MKAKLLLSSLLLSASIVAPLHASAALPQKVNGQQIPSLSTMLTQVMPSVVNIVAKGKITQNQDPFSEPANERGQDTP